MAVSHRAGARCGRRRARFVAAALALAAALGGCAVPAPPDAGGDGLILASASELGDYNPLRGYGELGVSPLYDGLLRPVSSGTESLPKLEPALASESPTGDAGLTEWTVRLREGVRFHDGTAFDAADVVATYRAILDPASASDIASSLDMVSGVEAVDDATVRFTLKYPYVDFPARLLVAIAPTERLTGGPAVDSPLNREPIGTGPYRLTELTAERAVLEANTEYWRGAPQVRTVTTVYLPDDNARAQRMAAGEFDGTTLPPLLARTFEGKEGLAVDAVPSADWRGVSFPADNPFTRDAAARTAMNLAVDRQAILDAVLGGHGKVASTPVAPIYGDAYDAGAQYPHDPRRAEALLEQAGWRPGPDGIRRKGGKVASFTVAYLPGDTLRRDLATAFAADMQKVGVEVRLEGMTFDRIESQVGTVGILLGGGDKPYSLDTQAFGALHSQVPGSSPWDNPGGYATPALDRALQDARRASEESARAAAYRTVQREYHNDPSYVFLAFLDHTYVHRPNGWDPGPRVVEPHTHGVTWGPWWDLPAWRPGATS